jgi:hypothetical protein
MEMLMPDLAKFDQAKKLWENLKEIPTSILRIEDLHNKLSLCVTLLKHKKVTSIEPESDNLLPNLQNLREILRTFKLLTSVTTLRRIQPSLEATNISPKIRSFFVELNATKKPTIILWAYKDTQVPSLLKPKMTNSQIGAILGYPSHCIQEYNKYIVVNTERYVNALKTQYNTHDDDEIISLITRSAPVYYPKEDNAIKTLNTFTFLPYIACNKCLKGEYDISRKLNASFEKIARKVDSQLYNGILLEAKKLVALADQ